MIRSLSKGALAVALAVASGQTLAMCIGFSPPPGEIDPLKAAVKWEIDRSTAVFIGTVTAMEYVPVPSDASGYEEVQLVRMAADSSWKGLKSREITLNTLNYRSSDGRAFAESHDYPFELGKEYLVYALSFRGGLNASVCTRTKPIEAAARDIAALDALKAD